jgi:serine/threonine-protein kinase
METVLVQVPSADGGPPSQVVNVGPGDTLRFGRGAPDCRVDVVLPNEGVSRLAGEISAIDDYWAISNLSRDKTYVVDNPEGGGEYLMVPPRRIAAPVPFEFARVSLPVTGDPVSFLVFAPTHSYADPGDLDGLAGDGTTAAFSLDESAKYFLILVALCEQRLRDSSTVALPTAGEIVERLRGDDQCGELTRAAVNHHIDYLAITKLRVKEPRPGADERLEWKREAVVAIALRFGLVRDEHRRLLPPRAPAGVAGIPAAR